MAWYHDRGRTTYVTTYTDEKSMRREVEEAAKFGWVPQQTAGTGGHINVGRTAGRVALTGGLGLLFGASRSKDKVTITFIRDERWLARAAVEDACRTLEERRSKLQKSSQELMRAEELFASQVGAAMESDDLNRHRLEKDINKALKELIDTRESANKHRHQLLTALSSTRDAYSRAATASADVPKLPFNLDAEIDEVTQKVQWEAGRLQEEQALRQAQEQLVRAAESWQEASEKRQEAHAKLEKAANQVAEARTAAEGDPPERAEKAARKVRDSEEEEDKRRAELKKWDDELEKRAVSLGSVLGQQRAALTRYREQPVPITGEEPAATPPSTLLETPQAEGSAPSGDILAQIEKLADLNRAGILTDEEFAAKKAELLARL